MSRKVYHIVDPETGKVVGEKNYGLFTRFLFLTSSTKGKVLFWAALGAFVFLCLMLAALEPSLPGIPPSVFSVAREVPGCVVALLMIRTVLRFSMSIGRQKPEPSKSESESEEYYNIVDPESGNVVDRISVEVFAYSKAVSQEEQLAFHLKMVGVFFFVGYILLLSTYLFADSMPEEWFFFLNRLRPSLIPFGLAFYHLGCFLEKDFQEYEPSVAKGVEPLSSAKQIGLKIQGVSVACIFLSIAGFDFLSQIKNESSAWAFGGYVMITLMVLGFAGIYIGFFFIQKGETARKKT